MSEEKLKPCPFCGKEPVYVPDGKVICCCGAMMKSLNDWKPFTNQEAVNRWNERVVDANKTITCFKCHGAGVFGVPYLDDNEEWDGRLNVRRCEVCGGTGEVEVVGDSVTDVCDKCGETGFFCEMRMGDVCTLGSPCPHQKPLTNEEWLKRCTTEQLAEFLADKCNEVVETVLSDASCDIGDIDNDDYWYRQADFVEWLKEKHE